MRAKEFINEDLRQVLQFATDAHKGQTRSGGEPYIGHPVRVAHTIQQFKQSHNIDALIAAAYLHDTIEDTDTTHEALHDLFGGLVASLVLELTSDLEQIKKVGKKEYLAKKMAHDMSSYGLVIKLADRLDNVQDIATAKSPAWRAKYKAETEHIMDYLGKNRVLSGTHQKLVGMIRDKLKEIPIENDLKQPGDTEHLMKEDSGNSTTLAQLYNGNYPDRDETFWDYVSTSELNTPLDIQTLQKHKVMFTLLGQYRAEHIDDVMDMLDDDRKELVQSYIDDPALSSKVIVMSGHRIIDGNHRALAAAIKGVPINYVDLADLD